MKIVNASAVLALWTLESCLVSASLEARQVPIAKYTLSGISSTGSPYPYYNISVLEDGVTNPITNPLIIYSISPEADFLPGPGPANPTSNCTFTLEDRSVVYVHSTYDIEPQKVVSVSCVPVPSTSSASSSGFVYASTATSVYPSATGPYTVSSVLPPYRTATGVYSAVGSPGVSRSTGPSSTGTGLTPGGKSSLPFTGVAGRVDRGCGILIGALIGAGVVLCWE